MHNMNYNLCNRLYSCIRMERSEEEKDYFRTDQSVDTSILHTPPPSALTNCLYEREDERSIMHMRNMISDWGNVPIDFAIDCPHMWLVLGSLLCHFSYPVHTSRRGQPKHSPTPIPKDSSGDFSYDTIPPTILCPILYPDLYTLFID